MYWQHSRINWEEKFWGNGTLFVWTDKFQKYPFLPKILFFTPVTRHARYVPSLEKSTLFKRFFFGHACVHCYIWVVPPGAVTLMWQDMTSWLFVNTFFGENRTENRVLRWKSWLQKRLHWNRSREIVVRGVSALSSYDCQVFFMNGVYFREG